MAITTSTFLYEEEAGIATITLNRPERLNALTFDVYAEMRDLFRTLGTREEVRAIVITGTGRGFCSGGDIEAIIGELLQRDTPKLLEFTRMTGELIRNIRAVPKPVVAAINGVAAGAGVPLTIVVELGQVKPPDSHASVVILHLQ